MKNLHLSLTAILFLVLTVLAGCAPDKNNSSDDTPKENVSQEITTNLGGEPYTLDPAFASDTTSFWVIQHLYEGLLEYDKDGQLVEGAASKIDVSEDGKIYTFTIKEGLKWSNGDAITAKDFEYAWKRVLNPETAAYSPTSFYYIKGAENYNTGNGAVEEVGITAPDDLTLVVELSSPTAFFKQLLARAEFLPVNQSVVEAKENWAGEADSIVTNGAYILDSWKHDQQIVLVKNENYWNNEAISMEKINFEMVADATTYYQMFKTGELDLINSLPLDSIEQEKNNNEYVSSPSFSVYTFSFNVEEKPFTNKKIRQALSYAIDREAIVNNITKAGEASAFGYVPFGFITPNNEDFRNQSEKYYEFNPERAKQLLEEGLKEEGWSELPTVTFKYNTADNHKKIAEAVQEMIKQNLGVNVNLENQEWKTYIDTFKQKNFQVARMGWGGEFLDPLGVLSHYTTTNSSNFTNWSNAEYDQLIEASNPEQDPAKRIELLQKAEAILMEELPIIPILFSAQNALVSEKIEGIRFDVLRNPDLRFAKRVE
ncbi:peptide ABC transporter substrate-binding protein [Cytobacillus purgationiresistens]|uniref:peptide ABC transporter substrate-binding protein n=1 Tax=Cytobacillus purgationiresistens TaxID=863449 RepID=UPI0027D87BD8|nr:peptide ABC transporter substrate-binding protein [Cytobacillus purgationiresistens]